MLKVTHIYEDKANDFKMFNAYLASDDTIENELDTLIIRDGKFFNIYFLDEERWVYDDDERPECLTDCLNAAMQELMDREVTFKFGETMETLEKEAEEYETENRAREEKYKEFCEKNVKPYFFDDDEFYGQSDS